MGHRLTNPDLRAIFTEAKQWHGGRYLPHRQLNAVLTHLKQHRPVLALIFELQLLYGLRLDEIHSAKPGHYPLCGMRHLLSYLTMRTRSGQPPSQ